MRKRPRSYWTDIGYVTLHAAPESLAARLHEIAVILRAMKKIRRTVRVTTSKHSDSSLVFQALRK